jgi:hypothetical protein
MAHPSHSSWHEHPNNIWWGVQIIKLLIMLSSHAALASSFLDPNIFLSTLFSITISLFSSFNVSDQVSHS